MCYSVLHVAVIVCQQAGLALNVCLLRVAQRYTCRREFVHGPVCAYRWKLVQVQRVDIRLRYDVLLDVSSGNTCV
jgi:hypothetical protein